MKNRGDRMKIKRKFMISNVAMFLIPIVLISIISAIFLIIFVMRYPVHELQISRAALLSPKIFSRALGDFFTMNPSAIRYVCIWAIACVVIAVVTTTVATTRLARSIIRPIRDLTEAANQIREGKLDFEVLGSEYEEFDELCSVFDQMRRQLKNSKEKEAFMRQERSMLLANLSHDLKTPITSIKGYIEGIRDGIADTPDKMEKYLTTVYAKAGMIEEMVNNLSTFSRLELSKMHFTFAIGDLNDFLKEVAEEYRLDIESKGLRLCLDIPQEKAMVRLDYEHLHRVFANLIDNAMKYTKNQNGEIRVSSYIEQKGVFAQISDDGIGIAKDQLQSVFEEFYRVDPARNLNIKGSGLGLGIAKQIVSKHGGKIWLRSEEGQGTTAVIYLPLVKGEQK